VPSSAPIPLETPENSAIICQRSRAEHHCELCDFLQEREAGLTANCESLTGEVKKLPNNHICGFRKFFYAFVFSAIFAFFQRQLFFWNHTL
jgi:hypothetical protein